MMFGHAGQAAFGGGEKRFLVAEFRECGYD